MLAHALAGEGVKFSFGDTPPFDPAKLDPVERFAIPASPLTRTEKPAGN
jgi:hypothetical protein